MRPNQPYPNQSRVRKIRKGWNLGCHPCRSRYPFLFFRHNRPTSRQAYKSVGESTEIPLTYYFNNVSATISLLQTMSEFNCVRFVYSSSATVYGTPPTIPIPEQTRLKADSPYGKSKIMSETIVSDLCQAEPGRWRAISLRYFKCVI